MNIRNFTTAIIFVLLSLNANATKYKFIASDNSVESRICALAGNNDRSELTRTMMYTGYNIRKIVNTVTCNDMVMAHFAHKYEASHTFKYLNRLSSGKNKLDIPSVKIRDIAAVNHGNEETKIILVSSGK